MAKKPANPILDNLDQFSSHGEALKRIALEKPFDDLAMQILESYNARGGEWDLPFAFFCSAASRGRALHEATVREITKTNPPASITLLRQLAETVAMTFYVADHPDYVSVLATLPSEKKPGEPNRKSMQTLVNYMDRHYTDQFAVVYADMCEMTHFGTSALWSSHSVKDDDGKVTFSWSSVPKWKTEKDALICCALLLELTQGMRGALIALGETLIRLAERSAETARG